MNVVSVEAKGDKAAILILEDGTRIWTPEKAKADALIGKPIPADWTQKQGEYGPQAFPPRDKNAPRQSSWQNSEAGVRFIQERTDRRTALMQAVALVGGADHIEAVAPIAAGFYGWLTKDADKIAGVSGQGESPGDSTAATTESGHATAPPAVQQGSESHGEGGTGSCSHVFVRGVCKNCGRTR